MNIQKALLLALMLAVIPAVAAQAQVQIVAFDKSLSGSASANIYRPVIPVRVIYLPSAYNAADDAIDTADAARNQYFAEDEFQTMAVGF